MDLTYIPMPASALDDLTYFLALTPLGVAALLKEKSALEIARDRQTNRAASLSCDCLYYFDELDDYFLLLYQIGLADMKLDPDLLSTSAMNEFNAVLNAHGLYNTEQFVLRLSPRNHELINQIGADGHTLSEVSIETLQAYSTYLHETIHWWQHVGSTTGLLLSTCFPNQTHMNFSDIAEWCKIIRPSKSIKAWSYQGELDGNTHLDSAQALANTITNNFMDIQFFKIWLLRPELSTNLYDDPYFESQGHCFQVAYHGLISNIQPIIDPSSSFLPDQNKWELNFRELAEANRTGYYFGSPIVRRHTSLAELWEAQASFSQMQFLTRLSPSMTLDDFRKAGKLYGIYEAAFLKFFEITGIDIPTSAVDSRIALFLLVIDLAINPVEGFPCEIVDYANFVLSADPNIRFEVICQAIASEPHSYAHAIQEYSKTEYLEVSQRLSEACGLRHLSEGWQEIARWKSLSHQVQQLLTERETFEFAPTNLVLRVLLSHFIEFTADRSAHPEFFCWPGYWKANPSTETTQLWLKHLSLFSDKADDGASSSESFQGEATTHLSTPLMCSLVTAYYLISPVNGYSKMVHLNSISGGFQKNTSHLSGRAGQRSILRKFTASAFLKSRREYH